MKVDIFTDGGSRQNGSPEAISGYGVILIYGEHIKEYYEGFLQKTNNQMEIMGVIKGLSMLKREDVEVEVFTDSAYVVGAMTTWYKDWIKKGWKNSKKKPVENRELWEELIELKDRFKNVTFTKVKGHSGHVWNERADELANKAMDEIENEI